MQSDTRVMEESTFEGDPFIMTSVENMNIEENFGTLKNGFMD
jgi:hypothetical protein